MGLFSRFFNKYPYTDFHELNLDWVIETVQDLEEKVTELNERVEAAEARLTQAEADIDALEGRATALEGRATTLEGRATALEDRATTLEGRATSLEGRTTALEGRATALEDRADDLESDVSTNATAINGLQASTTVNAQNIGILDGRVDDLEDAISGVLPGYQGEYYQNITENGWTIDQDVDTTLTDYHFEMTGQRSGEIVSLHGKLYFGLTANASAGGPLYSAELLSDLKPTTLGRHVAQRIICATDSGAVVFLTLDIYRANENVPGYIDIHVDPDTPHMPTIGEEISTGYFTIAYVK